MKKKLIVLVLLLISLTTFFLSRTPDLSLAWSRTLPTQSTSAQLHRWVRDTRFWPLWFHHLQEAQILNPSDHPHPAGPQTTLIFQNALVSLKIHHKKTTFLKARISEYQPHHLLKLDILEDSSQKLTRAFETLQWVIVFQDRQVQGSVQAKTSHWRARLSARLSQDILLYQAFYPNLLTLSQLTAPPAFEHLFPAPKSSGF